jgi:flagellar protein FliJ
MYRFSLETVLTHRKHAEDALRKELAQIQSALREAEQKMAGLDETITENLATIYGKQRDGASVTDITLYDNYIKLLSRERGRQVQRIRQMEHRLVQKRDVVVEAMKERKILERLKEKELEAYQKELERKERILMSEIAINGFNMRRPSS